MMSRRITTKVEQRMQHKIAEKLSVLLGTYVDPYNIELWVARGYWTHTHQDCMRFTGQFPRPNLPNIKYSIGSWESLTVLDRKDFVISDERNVYRSDADFMLDLK